MATSQPSSSNARRPLTVEVSTSYGSQESSGPTPEPSPVGPPKATEYNNHLIEDTTHTNTDSNNNQVFRRHNVLLHPLQESDRSDIRHDVGAHENPLAGRRIPSPYSPPPESLISDDERLDHLPAHLLDADERGIPNRNRSKSRPPLQEVSVEGSRRSAGSTRNFNGDRVGNGAAPPPPPPIGNSFSFEADLQQQLRHLAALQQRSAASPGSASMHTAQASPATHHHIHRSQLLPAVVQLKRELLEAHQSAFLLRREHEASNAKHVEAQNELRSTVNQLQEELGALRHSNSDLVRQLADATEETKMASSAVRTLQAEKTAAEAQLQASLEERNELQAALHDQGQKLESVRASNQELSEGVASLEQKVQNLSHERGDLMEEVKQLRESLGRENGVAASTILALQSDKESLRNDLSVTKGLVERSKVELKESRDLVQSLQEEVKATRLKLKHVLAESTQRANELQEQFDMLQLAESRGREASQNEIERLKACLKEGELKSAAIEKDAESAKIMLKTEIAGLEKSLKASTAQCAALRGEKLALRKELSVKTQLLQRLESVVTAADAACQTDAPVAVHEFGTQTESESHSFASSTFGSGDIFGDGECLADRVGRIRDASDRASLTQAYRREVNRIQEENAAELRRAEESYNASLASVIQDAKSEVHRQTRDLRQKLKAEWESKLTSLEKQRQRELDQVSAVEFALFNVGHRSASLTVPFLSWPGAR
jgi:DNA repair exonuclease SbcCD ATPase subunit